MPQVHLPLFPDGSCDLSEHLAFEKRDHKVTYFYGAHPIFTHDEDDLRSFRMFTSQLIASGAVKGAQVQRSFGLPAVTVKRYVKQFREKGTKSFFAPKVHRGPAVLTDDILKKAQELLDEGFSRKEVALKVGVKIDTLRKAIAANRLHENIQKKNNYRTNNLHPHKG